MYFKFLPVFAFWSMMISANQAGAANLINAVQSPSRSIPSSTAVIVKMTPKSFREWKNERVQASKLKVDTLITRIDQSKLMISRELAKTEGGLGKDIQLEKLEQQLEQAQFSFDLAQDLSVTDYFVGYLTKMDNRKAAINSVAGKLSSDEVAELMNAYANSFFGVQGASSAGSEASRADDAAK